MAEALDRIQDDMRDHAAESRFNRYIADMLKVQLEMNPGLKPEVRAKVEAKITPQEAAAKKYEKKKGADQDPG